MISNGDFNSYVRLPGISQVYTSCRPGENSLRTFQKILSNKGACLETPYSVHFRMIIHNYIYTLYWIDVWECLLSFGEYSKFKGTKAQLWG